MTRYTPVLVALFLSVAPVAHAQSLAEAAEKASAIKAARLAKGEWIPSVSAAVPTVPVSVAPVVSVTTDDKKPEDKKADALEPVIEPSTLAKNQAAGAALLETRLAALSTLQADRDRNADQYRDACAGKVASAGWLLRGQLITTANEETPVCRSLASDLASQRAGFTREHAAIEVAAHTAGIFPGVLRDLFASHGLPN